MICNEYDNVAKMWAEKAQLKSNADERRRFESTFSFDVINRRQKCTRRITRSRPEKETPHQGSDSITFFQLVISSSQSFLRTVIWSSKSRF